MLAVTHIILLQFSSIQVVKVLDGKSDRYNTDGKCSWSCGWNGVLGGLVIANGNQKLNQNSRSNRCARPVNSAQRL